MNYLKLLVSALICSSMSIVHSKNIQVCNDTHWFISIDGKIAVHPYNGAKISDKENSVPKFKACKTVFVPDNKSLSVEISGVDLESNSSYGVATLKFNSHNLKKLHIFLAGQKDRKGTLPGIEIN